MTKTPKIVESPCADFTEAVAAKASIPGGGATAALCGALAAALCSMVGNLSLGKGGQKADEEIEALLSAARAARLRLLELVDEDARAFSVLSGVYAMAKDDPERPRALETAYRNAIEPPLAMMHETVRIISLLQAMDQKSSTLLRSDIGCGAALAAAALRSAAMNVLINTKVLHDRTHARTVNATCNELLACEKQAHDLANKVTGFLEGKPWPES